MSFRGWLKKLLTLKTSGANISTMEDIREIIRKTIRKKGSSIRGIAKEMGFDHANFVRMLKEGSDPRLKTLERIVDHLGYSLTLKKKEVKDKEKGRPGQGGKDHNYFERG